MRKGERISCREFRRSTGVRGLRKPKREETSRGTFFLVGHDAQKHAGAWRHGLLRIISWPGRRVQRTGKLLREKSLLGFPLGPTRPRFTSESFPLARAWWFHSSLRSKPAGALDRDFCKLSILPSCFAYASEGHCRLRLPN
jgi:hypothetical protein